MEGAAAEHGDSYGDSFGGSGVTTNASLQMATGRRRPKKTVSFSESISTVSYSTAEEPSSHHGEFFRNLVNGTSGGLPEAGAYDAEAAKGPGDGGDSRSAAPAGGSSCSAAAARVSAGSGEQHDSIRSTRSAGSAGSVGGGSHSGSSSGGSTASIHAWFWRGWLTDQPLKFYQDIGTGTWREVTFHMLTATATPAAYSPLPWAMARLTWYGGVPMLLFSIACFYYCAMLTANLHTWKVVIRFCRYRDLAKSVWGAKGHHLAFSLQQMGSLGNNVAIQLSSALVMKDIYKTYNPDGNVSVHIWLIVFACMQLVLCQLPTLHHLRHLNIFATAVSLAFAGLITVYCFIEGPGSAAVQPVSYDVVPGDLTAQIMGGFTAAGTMAFSLANILLPEIQAVARPPAALNGRKGVTAAFSTIGIMYPLVAVSGFYAFGNQVSSLVVLSLPEQHSWAAITAKLLLIINASFNYQVFGQPSFEVIEYLLMDDTASLLSVKNCLARFFGSLVYVITLSFLAALLPGALPNVASVIGAVCYVSLDVVIPLLMDITARKPGPLKRFLHLAGSGLWMCIAVLAVIGSVYDLATRADALRFFENASA